MGDGISMIQTISLVDGSPSRTDTVDGRHYRGPFAVMTVLFFMWGFMTVWNDLLIPRFKEAFALSYFEAMLVQFAFFGAYGVGSLAYFSISAVWGDPISKVGYKNGVVVGLVIAAVGSSFFLPGAVFASYPLFLVALFIVGLGFAMLQIVANPYVAILGPERTASSRLNLSQAFNSLGTTISPSVGGWLLFRVFATPGASGAETVKVPYLCFAGVFAALAATFALSCLPNLARAGDIVRGPAALRHRHTVLGMVAIFMYVGGEVAVGSSIVSFLGAPMLGGLTHESASRLLSYYWGGLMIGRFMGAGVLSELGTWIRRAWIVSVALLALLVVVGVAGRDDALRYGSLLFLLVTAFFAGGQGAPRMLALFGGIAIVLLAVGILANGSVAKWAILGVGMFCSIMWSNIFSLAIDGLGTLKSQASSLLIMSVLGGAIIPPLQGALADRVGIQDSFIVPMAAFAYVVYYGGWGCKSGRTKEAA
jgi:MFS transporter, FHS family, L-fucose permease